MPRSICLVCPHFTRLLVLRLSSCAILPIIDRRSSESGSIEPDSELRLSIMGSIAQEESRKTSSRVKWGQTRQMERGVVFGRSMLGYDVKSGKMTVNPD